MKIAVFEWKNLRLPRSAWAPLERAGETVYFDCDVPAAPEDCPPAALDADVIFCGGNSHLGENLRQMPNLRFVSLFSTGYNNVDLALTRELGVAVSNVPHYGAHSVGQFTISLLLEICNNVGGHCRAIREGMWDKGFTFLLTPQIELYGKTIGVIGYGDIGREVAAICAAFGMRVLAFSRHPDPAQETERIRFAPLDEIYRTADFITLHYPLLPHTAGMIDRAALAQMKDGVIILNTARGGLIDEQALADALRAGKVASAGLDVVSKEPWDETCPLFDAPNVVITPHLAWATEESRRRLFSGAVENFQAWLTGAPQNLVN